MTIKQIDHVEHDSGFGFFFDRELTREVESMNDIVREAGQARFKRVRLYFGNPYDGMSAITSGVSGPIIISSSTHPEENQNLGEYMLSGVRHAKEMWFTLSHTSATEISITPVRWTEIPLKDRIGVDLNGKILDNSWLDNKSSKQK